jgi:hypothetical protein
MVRESEGKEQRCIQFSVAHGSKRDCQNVYLTVRDKCESPNEQNMKFCLIGLIH